MQEVVLKQNPNDPNTIDMYLEFQATLKQKEAFKYRYDDVTTEI